MVAPQLTVVTSTIARSDVAVPVKDARAASGVPSAVAGLMRQGSRNQQAAQAQQQAQAQAQAGRSNYDRAYAACLEGRGYQVR